MSNDRLVFAQLMDHLPLREFRKCVDRYPTKRRSRTFSALDQFLCMAYAQLSGRESLRDIEFCLRSVSNKIYHMGIRGIVSRSTLADANERRNWRIFADFAQCLVVEARKLHIDEIVIHDFDKTVYALDSSTIDLCLELFPWAKFRKTKGAIKLHTLLDIKGSIPTFICITDGKTHDVNILDHIHFESGAYYIMDRGYQDLKRFFRLHKSGAFFVTRPKKSLLLNVVNEKNKDLPEGIISDSLVKTVGNSTSNDYPDLLRMICYYDKERSKLLEFITNDFFLMPNIIADLYKSRWRVELFFKWIKQHLRIKVFFGTSENAVKTQIWIAVSVYLIIAIMRKKTGLTKYSLYQVSQILGAAPFEKVFISTLFLNLTPETEESYLCKQLSFLEI